MSIVLHEREWAENAIANRNLGRLRGEGLKRVAKYYLQCEGYNSQETRNKLESLLLQCDPKVSIAKWDERLDRYIRDAKKEPLFDIDGVTVYKEELEVIDALEGSQIRRLAFVLLCVAKYRNALRIENDNWGSTSDSELMKMANVNTSTRKQSLMWYRMRDAGLIRYSKRVDNLNVRVLYLRESGEEALFINDFRNLGNQYLLYAGEPLMQCVECGLIVKRGSNAQRYCPDCATEMYVKNAVEAVMRRGS